MIILIKIFRPYLGLCPCYCDQIFNILLTIFKDLVYRRQHTVYKIDITDLIEIDDLKMDYVEKQWPSLGKQHIATLLMLKLSTPFKTQYRMNNRDDLT
ncbi:hypothetical protein RCL_jg4981.t1 [Rhizophagus clarus]|uniref:Uncharacterized protein n=1 Tax=Rhizophagus clarus TaxID=94130 RepID=A0A8H3QIM7_9GLOM|nr:hypothetical protein RCL_jg4981.t1 [Rhizophagus clarus]